MRTLILTLAFVFGLLMIQATSISNSSTGLTIGTAVVLDAQAVDAQQPQQQPQPPQINVEVKRDGGGRAWYLSPVWMAIGGIALVVVILLIVMAAKGGGTTVVRG